MGRRVELRLNLSFFLSLGVAILAGITLVSSLSWPFRAALFPRVLGVPLLILSIVQMLLSASAVEEKRAGHAVDFEFTSDIDHQVARQRTISIFAWILGFLALILLVGFPLAVPLFVFLYLKLAGGEAWILTLLLTGFSWLFMEGLFDWLLHIPFPEGWLFLL